MATRKSVEHYRALPYTRRVQPCEEEGAAYWLAWMEELPSVEIHGASREEALARLDQIFDDCILAMIDAGDAIPEPPSWPSGVRGEDAKRNLARFTAAVLRQSAAEQRTSDQGDQRSEEHEDEGVPEWGPNENEFSTAGA